jgi:hypothetical protein
VGSESCGLTIDDCRLNAFELLVTSKELDDYSMTQ